MSGLVVVLVGSNLIGYVTSSVMNFTLTLYLALCTLICLL
uniref:Uncharacterized protein n=1 Tax=Arundo donax TaxID=35708 RepID=A0A0A9EEZ0_ARUDO